MPSFVTSSSDLVAAERGQALQAAEVEDCFRLLFAEAERVSLTQRMPRIGDESDQRTHVFRRPVTAPSIVRGP